MGGPALGRSQGAGQLVELFRGFLTGNLRGQILQVIAAHLAQPVDWRGQAWDIDRFESTQQPGIIGRRREVVDQLANQLCHVGKQFDAAGRKFVAGLPGHCVMNETIKMIEGSDDFPLHVDRQPHALLADIIKGVFERMRKKS